MLAHNERINKKKVSPAIMLVTKNGKVSYYWQTQSPCNNEISGCFDGTICNECRSRWKKFGSIYDKNGESCIFTGFDITEDDPEYKNGFELTLLR